MPFGLKNAEATYKRLVTKIFSPLFDNTMEAYIDDMLVKSKEICDNAKHLQEAFELLQRYGMKLKPLKCVLGVGVDKFLGFIVTQRGIEANPLQLKNNNGLSDSYLQKRGSTTDQLAGSSWVVYISLHQPVKTIFHHPEGSQRGRLE